MVAIYVTIAVVAFGTVAEFLHWRRCRRVAPLAFGPARRPRPWVYVTPLLRVAALGLAVWGLTTLLLLPPKVHKAEVKGEDEFRHLVVVLDVSPSMRLQDAGPDKKRSRAKRVAAIFESLFKRIVMEQMRVSVVAVYTGAKPVVVDTKDIEVVRNILNDLPLHHAFEVGKTQLFSGLEVAAGIAKPWKPGTASLILISDGDTVPATGMPKMPPSISEVLVIGVGDPRTGKFIDGHQSRQDIATLRQIAHRLRGEYHDGNEKHVPTDSVNRLMHISQDSSLEKLGKREYAIISLALGAAILAFLPLFLTLWGIRWRPGMRRKRDSRTSPERSFFSNPSKGDMLGG